MSADRLQAPPGIGELIEQAEERGRRMQRVEDADRAGRYPLQGFCYDTNNQGEILRLRDTISEAILKNVPIGEMIR